MNNPKYSMLRYIILWELEILIKIDDFIKLSNKQPILIFDHCYGGGANDFSRIAITEYTSESIPTFYIRYFKEKKIFLIIHKK